jgi:integrase
MARTTERLTALKVERIRTPGMYADGGGLYLQVTKGGASWIYRFMLNGRAREMGLGPLAVVTLSEARASALDARRLHHRGIDPIEAGKAKRAQARLEAAKAMTFQQCADAYIEAHRAGWRNGKHAAQWAATLRTYAYPVFGDLPVAAIDTALVMKVVEPVWATKTETATRLRGRIERVLDWAKVRGYRAGENPAHWQGHLDHLLPKRSKVARIKHHPALAYRDMPAFMAKLRKREGMSARALEFTILTAARTGAVIGASWDEMDLSTKVWRVPLERAGTKITGEEPKPRRVPLSGGAVEILNSLARAKGNPHVFIGEEAGQGLSNMAMAELLKDMAAPSTTPGKFATVHGMRSAFKDWSSEQTNFANEVSEAALWHVVADKVEAAYRRGDMFEKRRRLMEAWATFCTTTPTKHGKVVSLQGRS